MAEICPFRGIRYNQEMVGGLAEVVCPPYDVISAEEQKAYYNKSDYNVVRLEHSMESPDDTETNNKHIRAAATFNQWLKDGILQADSVPAFYIHEHIFDYQDVRKKRLGLIACVKLESWESKVILPHENTAPGIKSDRLELMRACAANFSPIFGLYEDPGQRVAQLLISRTSRKPLVTFTEASGTHNLWLSNEPEFVQRISHFLAPKSIYIADGHHRYETALTYRDEKKCQDVSSVSDSAAFNFIMMTLVSLSNPGIIALPIHRLVRGISSQTLAELKNHLETFFEMGTFQLDESGVFDVKGATIRILGLEPGSIVALRLRQSAPLEGIMPERHSEAYQKLDVSILQHLIIDRLLGATNEAGNVDYTPDVEQARKKVESGEYQLAFLLNPIPVTTIKAIADANDRMPGKSTYFYPKLPAGLVLNRLEGRVL